MLREVAGIVERLGGVAAFDDGGKVEYGKDSHGPVPFNMG
jgi:hypothetical protein